MNPNFERLQRQANREGAAWRANEERKREESHGRKKA